MRRDVVTNESPRELNTTLHRSRRDRRGLIGSAAAVCLIAFAGYAPTTDTRAGYYIDDYVLRELVTDYGWPNAYLHSWMGVGVRPLGLLHMMAWYHWVWDWPIVPQIALMIQHAMVCLLLFILVREITKDARAAIAAAAVFAAWHSYTGVVTWTALGVGMLPATGGLLASLWLYVRHLRLDVPSGTTLRRAGSIALFTVSLLFYDQQIGAPVLFAALAVLISPRGSRLAQLIRTWPFWAASVLIGTLYLLTANTSNRTLDPQLGNILERIAIIASAFWSRIQASEMIAQWLGRWGAPGAFYAYDPQRLAVAAIGLLAGAALLYRLLRQPAPRNPHAPTLLHLAVVGASLTLVSLIILTLSPWTLAPRHTLLPAMGIAMLIAAAFARMRGLRLQRISNVALVALVLGLSTLRLGYVYEWTIRTRVADTVVHDLAELFPDPAAGDLVVVDGVRQYGQCFLYSFEFSHEFSDDRGVDVNVTTELRNDAGMLLANLDWYDWYPVDLESTHFFLWDQAAGHLKPSCLEEYLQRHPEMTSADNTERVFNLRPLPRNMRVTCAHLFQSPGRPLRNADDHRLGSGRRKATPHSAFRIPHSVAAEGRLGRNVQRS